MADWKGESKANVLGYKIFGFFIKHFGIRPSYFLLVFVALYYFLFSWKSSLPILYLFQKRLGYSKTKALRMLYLNYFSFGQTLIDRFAVLANGTANYTFNFDGEVHLREMVQQQKGGILLSAHAGNWEAAGHLLQRLNSTINIVMFDGEHEKIKNYLEKSNTKSFKVIYVKKDLSHIYKITEALTKNEIICIHADRFLKDNKTLTADFLNAPARFPEGPFLLALKLKVPVAYVFAFKDSATKYHFYSSEIKNYHKADGHSIYDVLGDFIAELEKMVRKYPTQWYNYYDFWKEKD